MKWRRNITSASLVHAKGFFFLVLGCIAAALLFAEIPTLKTATLIGMAIWAFCRFYYYLFYVLERYLGRKEPFSGVFDALRYLLFSSRGWPGA